MRSTLSAAALAVIATVQAASCPASGSPSYYTLPGFPSTTGCYPLNYGQTYDLGSTNPTDGYTKCSQFCVSYSSPSGNCQGFVAQVNKAADSNNYSGTCFIYTSGNVPTGPRSCASPQAGSTLYGGEQDNTPACFSSSSVAASAFCSSYLSIGKTTVYTATVTPHTTVTSVQTKGATSTSVISVGTTTTTTTTAYSTTVSTFTGTATGPFKRKRAAATQPACIASGVPASQLSADCSCLSVSTSTVSTVKTLPTQTVTIQSATTISATRLVTSVTGTSVVSSTTTNVASSTTTNTGQTCSSNSQSNTSVNGGFNDGQINGWTISGSGTAVASNEHAECGDYSVKLTAPAGQSVTITQTAPGFSGFEFGTIYYYIPVEYQNSGCTFLVMASGTGGSVHTGGAFNGYAPGHWDNIIATLNGGAITATMTVDCTGQSAGASAFFDEFTVMAAGF